MDLSVPKVAAVHDMSCVGRCSLTVIAPVLSCLGIQACPLPTAVLSTHFGGFAGVAMRDLTEEMKVFYRHWLKEGVTFDCIYSGFLASERQIDVVAGFIDEFSASRPLVVVDPVMGDNGRLYSVYTPTMQQRMATLVRKADVITPNYTEACFLLGERYEESVRDPGLLREWLTRLAGFGPRTVVMTGIPVAAGKVMNLGYDARQGVFREAVNDFVPVRYPGTGDIFASVLVGCLLRGQDLAAAMAKAAGFVAAAVRETFAAATPAREGVLLERVLPRLLADITREGERT